MFGSCCIVAELNSEVTPGGLVLNPKPPAALLESPLVLPKKGKRGLGFRV